MLRSMYNPTSKSDGALSIICLKKVVTFRSCSREAGCCGGVENCVADGER